MWLAFLSIMLMPCAYAESPGEKKALAIVCQRPEVKRWEKLLIHTKGAGKAGFIVTHDAGDNYTVQVMEDRAEQDVTFNFYHVNVKTRKVKKDF
jgi:hypothetical protein